MLEDCGVGTYPYPYHHHHLGFPQNPLRTKIPPYPNFADPFDPGINLPIFPTTPEQSQTAQPKKGTVPTNNGILIPPQTKQKPPIPLRPIALGNREFGIPGVSSEMESDDYHHISEHLQRAAVKINKTKLAITLQDKDKPPSQLSESDEEIVTNSDKYPYDDGEVAIKKIMPSEQWNLVSVEEGEFLIPKEIPREPILKSNNGDARQNPTTSTPFSPPSGYEINRQIEDELRNWTGAGTRIDDRYYSYSDEGCPAKFRPIDDAIIYHPQHGNLLEYKDHMLG